VDVRRIMAGSLNREEWARVVVAAAELKKIPLAISHRPGMRLGQLRADVRRKVRELRNKQGGDLELGLIVVDYIQLLDGERQRGDSRESEVAGISRGLKWIAGEFGCPVLALSQLNRELEKRPDKRPQMSDLRESGAIEQDAYAILFLYRDEVYNKNSADVGTCEVIVAANRNGPPGKIRLSFAAEHVRFDTLSEEWSGVGEETRPDYDYDDPRLPPGDRA
jgi:replicative DNA helicase